MSQENVEVVRRASDTQVLVHVRERVLALGHRTGRGKTSGLEVEQTAAVGLFHLHAGKVTRLVFYFDLGEQTLLFYVLHGRGRKSGAEVAMQGAQLFRWHDGLGVYGKTYAHREDALGDLGLSEDALEPIAPEHVAVSEQDAHADS